jgi:hypothetical protein
VLSVAYDSHANTRERRYAAQALVITNPKVGADAYAVIAHDSHATAQERRYAAQALAITNPKAGADAFAAIAADQRR